jgi:hypothetical protein
MSIEVSECQFSDFKMDYSIGKYGGQYNFYGGRLIPDRTMHDTLMREDNISKVGLRNKSSLLAFHQSHDPKSKFIHLSIGVWSNKKSIGKEEDRLQRLFTPKTNISIDQRVPASITTVLQFS